MMNIRIPKDFVEYNGVIMSNLDSEIDYAVAKAIKGERYYSQYAGWNFCGSVWWQDNAWHCEVWRYGAYCETITANDLREIMSDVCSGYGYD